MLVRHQAQYACLFYVEITLCKVHDHTLSQVNHLDVNINLNNDVYYKTLKLIDPIIFVYDPNQELTMIFIRMG